MNGVIDVGGGNLDAFGAGVFDYCLDHQLMFDYCIGISAGAANCTSYLAKQRGRNLRFYTKHNVSKKTVSPGNFIRTGSVLDLDHIYKEISNADGTDPLDYDAFCENKAILYVVATDASTAEPVYFDRSHIRENEYGALAASCNLPGINKAYRFEGKDYYDGGYSDPIPIEKALKDGCDKVIVILTLPKDHNRDNRKDLKMARLMKDSALMKLAVANKAELYNRQLRYCRELEKQGKVLIIAPEEVPQISALGKNEESIRALYREGYRVAEAIPHYLKR